MKTHINLVTLMVLVLMVCVSCGEKLYVNKPPVKQLSEYENLREQVRLLTGQTQQLSQLISSDYATCPASGNTSDPLIRKICNVAQAATAEARVELKGQLAVFSQMLQTQIDAVNDGLANTQESLRGAKAEILAIQTSLVTFDQRLISAESAIAALQTLTASISGNLAGNMISFDIGNENMLAGPLYETVLRRVDRKRFNAYVETFEVPISLPNNPISTVLGSSDVFVSVPSSTVTITVGNPAVVTWPAHGLQVGSPIRLSSTGELPTGLVKGTIYYVASTPAPTADTFSLTATGGLALETTGTQSGVHKAALSYIFTNSRVRLMDVTEGAGFTSGDLAKEYGVATLSSDYSKFRINLGRAANATTTFGGTLGVTERVRSRGMGTIWKSQDPSDTEIRWSTLGSRRYSFIIRRLASDTSGKTAELCYDKSNSNATFATINAAAEGGSGNIVCK